MMYLLLFGRMIENDFTYKNFIFLVFFLFTSGLLKMITCSWSNVIFFFVRTLNRLLKKKLNDATTGLSVADRNRLDESLLGLKCCCYSCIIIYIKFLLSPCILLFFLFMLRNWIHFNWFYSLFYIIDTSIQTRFFTFN